MTVTLEYDEQTPLLKKVPIVTVVSIDSDNDNDVDDLKSEDSQARQSQLHTQFEHGLDFWEALSVYRPAVLWCIVVNVTVVLNGFDGALMGNLVGVKSFKQQFGHLYGEEYIISASWLGAFNYGERLLLLMNLNSANDNSSHAWRCLWLFCCGCLIRQVWS
jgi:hypothetical protein